MAIGSHVCSGSKNNANGRFRTPRSRQVCSGGDGPQVRGQRGCAEKLGLSFDQVFSLVPFAASNMCFIFPCCTCWALEESISLLEMCAFFCLSNGIGCAGNRSHYWICCFFPGGELANGRPGSLSRWVTLGVCVCAFLELVPFGAGC